MSTAQEPDAPVPTVHERDLRWEMRCDTCSPDWLARCTEPYETWLRAKAGQHEREQPGHTATVVPVGAT